MPAVMWGSGQVDLAKTWEELEDKVRRDQWWALDESEFRVEMAERAYRWSLIEILTTGTSEQFFVELARANVVKIVDDDYYGKDK